MEPLPELESYPWPFASLFRHPQSRPTWESLERYVTGLLTDLPRKNCDTIVAGGGRHLDRTLAAPADRRGLGPAGAGRGAGAPAGGPGPAGGLLVLDDTGLLKKGTGSVGVAREYCALGKVANCQVVVSAEYVADVPETSTPCTGRSAPGCSCSAEWVVATNPPARAHVPEAVHGQTKPGAGLTLVDRARTWGVPFAFFVVADAGYGQAPASWPGLRPAPALRLRGQAHLRPAAA